MKNDIFNLTDRRLETQHKKILRRLDKRLAKGISGYDEVVELIKGECDRFQESAMAWPVVLRRRSSPKRREKKGDTLEIQIKVVHALSRPDSAKYQQSMQYYGRPPSYVAHKRLISGKCADLAEQGLAIVRAAKTISEILTVLEQTKCSEENTSS